MGVSFPIDIAPDCPFGHHNIPFGIFSTASDVGLGNQRRAGVAIGNFVLELDVLAKHGFFEGTTLSRPLGDVFLSTDLNAFATFPAADRRAVRTTIVENLTNGSSALYKDDALNTAAFVPLGKIQMHLPMTITDYTDFFCSLVHAENALRLLSLPVPQAFYEYPMGYNGRISSIAVSNTDVVRPRGFFRSPGTDHPIYQPTQQLDFEVEFGAFLASPVEAGKNVTAREAEDLIFGYVLLNDWSSRDIQKYEMHPFGPFHSKSFLTSISAWVVMPEAMSNCPCRAPPSLSSQISPTLEVDDANHGLHDVQFSVKVSRKSVNLSLSDRTLTIEISGKGAQDVDIVRSNLADAFWSHYQMIAYQSSSGCGMSTGDLLGSGTLSSPPDKIQEDSKVAGNGCLAEILACKHILPDVGGRPMQWLEDGDGLTIEGWFTAADGTKAGFGGVTGLVVPAVL
ncbi:putative fumarylacetoacetate hydrolase [Rhizodiscina lignyota]|uniref:Fumarylacetoacetase n=1 Tax=Rhizodiscina lignyota TaxID=1504668 RepID=A0A9P4M828_9PEZI|nr:putative fumarylacetoacetate hydrolase [Rhizodiscina lignyota]